MALDRKKYEYKTSDVVRDIRPVYVRFGDWLKKKDSTFAVCLAGAGTILFYPPALPWADVIFGMYVLFFWWMKTRSREIVMKLPADSPYKDPRNMGPGKNGKAEGILYVGNDQRTGQEIWFSNSDARTHCLYLGTTGSGKTEGLKSMVTNALCWGSGFIYIDGKADTDLWSSLSCLVRRFGRDDDLLVLNYMTGNSNARAPSNSMNPFSSGSASYLTNMLVSLMPEAEGDNAMWKERAVSLISSLMPVLCWKRDNQDMPVSVNSIREYLKLNNVIKLSRDEAVPIELRRGTKGYLETLPGYVGEAFDDEGKEKPLGPDQPMIDSTTVRQQHGYLTMQFTRSLQSLGDDYGYIFDTQAADVDMIDVVLNRRILVVLIPALEKSGDETANLGKIVSATLKGMMGSTLGATVEGDSSKVIENKPTHSSTPFMTVFDEVGYYTAQGMAVMAAQARSLGFMLVFASQDLQSMEKRVKEEARSITANCNIKIFGKLQDPMQTREFFENQIGKALAAQVVNYRLSGDVSTGAYHDTREANIQLRSRADYDDLKNMKEGEAIISFAMEVITANIFYANPGHAKAMRVTRYVSLPPPDENVLKHASQITKLRDRLVSKEWTARGADVAVGTAKEIDCMADGLKRGYVALENPVEHGIASIAAVHAELFPQDAAVRSESTGGSAGMEAVMKAVQPPAAPPQAPQVSPVMPGNPMGFFSKNKSADTVVVQEQPRKWDDLAKTPEPGDSAEKAQVKAQEIQYVKQQLSQDVERILKDAGSNARKSIFRSGSGSDEDAAE